MKPTLLPRALLCLRWLCLVALVGAACQRTPIQLDTGTRSPTSPAAATAQQTAASAERTAVVREATGNVDVRASASRAWAPAKVGDQLAQGGQVRTGADSRALIQLTEGSKIRFGSDTVFAFKTLNPYPENPLTALELTQGKVWVLLNGGALDIETPLGIASARSAYLSADFDAGQKTLLVTCLQGTCSFGDYFIPGGSKFTQVKTKATGPELMSLADYGDWGGQIPEATQLAWLATEAVVQGNATLPVVPTATLARTLPAKPTATHKTAQPPTATPNAVQPSATPAPTDTKLLPTVTARPFTPIPPAPIMGRHVVSKDETLFCIARTYGVLPAAIAQANGLFPPFNVLAGQTLSIPAVQWTNIAPGPVCPPQFVSLYPGLSFNTPAPTAIGSLTLVLNVKCIANCDTLAADYVLHIEAQVAGGEAPYTFDPGIGLDDQFNSQPFGHCSDVHGLVTVTSADGQKAAVPWYYHDTACPTPTVSP